MECVWRLYLRCKEALTCAVARRAPLAAAKKRPVWTRLYLYYGLGFATATCQLVLVNRTTASGLFKDFCVFVLYFERLASCLSEWLELWVMLASLFVCSSVPTRAFCTAECTSKAAAGEYVWSRPSMDLWPLYTSASLARVCGGLYKQVTIL